ncbi:MAG: hypothetical protein HRT58_06145 [Crocinitomicaceae bacterium]|nr:hypothetical protein [Flavobacteriales bacterium]NQZ35224.1 hypothetical protein [Crocinitomicaceae bacterium]
MKNRLLYFVIIYCLSWGFNLSAQTSHNTYWPEAEFSEGYFEIANGSPNKFVLIINEGSANYTLIECEVSSPHKLKKDEEFPITFFSVLNMETNSHEESWNIIRNGDSISYVNIGFVKLIRNRIKPVFEIRFQGNQGIGYSVKIRKKFKKIKF